MKTQRVSRHQGIGGGKLRIFLWFVSLIFCKINNFNFLKTGGCAPCICPGYRTPFFTKYWNKRFLSPNFFYFSVQHMNLCDHPGYGIVTPINETWLLHSRTGECQSVSLAFHVISRVPSGRSLGKSTMITYTIKMRIHNLLPHWGALSPWRREVWINDPPTAHLRKLEPNPAVSNTSVLGDDVPSCIPFTA